MGLFGRLFTKPFASVTVERAEELIGDGATLVDVRTSNEWKAGHATAARHVPLDSLERRAGDLRPGTQVVTICKSGMRSAQAARLLAARGYTVSNVRGGMMAWQRAGKRVVASGGRNGTVI
ncbi:rhodanese-like domain-containing protein [Glaciibacter psychrotolerans]|uniref:Rhodanese-related sulfurtransferase n=1 Tax=Glaciibacter psychrotolerans TaxID=670054 RepID=A0A7Z0EE00_9MICO|nr:rhodanese-like domain-containing protein [Leifsonia psychrotolerans]NYJ19931.1 rhodanese-related sulfurtransferase [Leifsonia psychrotolerans]